MGRNNIDDIRDNAGSYRNGYEFWEISFGGDSFYSSSFVWIYSIDEATQTVNFAVRYAQNGFVWGDGESNVAGKDFSETVQGKYSVTKRKNSDHVYVCGKTVYDSNFDHDYDLYCDEDGVYSYDGFYNKAYSATKVE